MTNNVIASMDFSDKEGVYYIVFKTPSNRIKRVEGIDEVTLKRNSEDSVMLKIKKSKGNDLIYHYPNDLINLLDDLDVGII